MHANKRKKTTVSLKVRVWIQGYFCPSRPAASHMIVPAQPVNHHQ